MALTYSDSATLMNDINFRGRIKVSLLNFANQVLAEASTTPAHNTRLKWAQNALLQPDFTAQQIQPNVVMDPSVQSSGGSSIDDPTLQTAVENTIENLI
jgi:hypothetical protein